MPDPVTCPRCQTRLAVERDRRSRWLTCPRCLSSIPNPALSDVAPAPSPAPAAAAEPRPPEVLPVPQPPCPDCGQPVEPSWRYCPFCDAPLGSRWEPEPEESLEADVRRDTSAIGIGLAVLGLLGGGGMIVFYCGGGMSGVRSRSAAEQAAGIGVLIGVILFGLVVTGMVLGGVGKSGGGRLASTVLSAIALGVLGLAVGIAGIVYLFAGCFEPCGRRRQGEVRPPGAAAPPPAAWAALPPGPPARRPWL
jgi:hypothetical protein